MSQKKRSGPTLNARLTRWESALAMVLLVDAFEERILFRYPELPPWAQVLIKMAIIIGMFGILLAFLNRRIEGGLSVTRAVSDWFLGLRIVSHAIVLGAVFVGFYWLKIGRLPWT